MLTIPFPCQFRQNEIELCQDRNQDRVNQFQFRFREKHFRQYETEFCQKENFDFDQISLSSFCVKLSFATAEMNFVHAKLILFLAKLSCTLAIFNFVQAELTFISAAKFRWKRYSIDLARL